jgi:hypothetical protein
LLLITDQFEIKFFNAEVLLLMNCFPSFHCTKRSRAFTVLKITSCITNQARDLLGQGKYGDGWTDQPTDRWTDQRTKRVINRGAMIAPKIHSCLLARSFPSLACRQGEELETTVLSPPTGTFRVTLYNVKITITN